MSRERRRPLTTREHVDPKARVLVVTSGWPHPENPGHCVFIQREMESLSALGVRYEVLFIRGYQSKLAYVVAAVRLFGMNFRRRRHSLVHCYSGEAALPAAFYRRAPLLVTYLGGDLLYDSARRDGRVSLVGRARCWIIRAHSRVASATITRSREMEATLPSGVRRRNHVIPHGVDLELFHPVDRARARAQLGWSESERVALYAANPAEERKRYPLTTAVVKHANAVLGNVRLAVAHRIDPERMPIYMSAADCLVLLSRMEGSCNVVKEALMCNLPVVATAVGDNPELLDGVHPSFLVEPTTNSAGAALIACLERPTRSNGRERSQRLNATALAARVLTVYRSLMSDRAAPADLAQVAEPDLGPLRRSRA